MKKLIIIFLTFITSTGLWAQMPGANGGNRGAGMNGRFYGRVVDATSNKGLEAASVQLLQNKMDSATRTKRDVIINGMLTDAKGNFSLEDIPVFGQYRLKITGIGFKEMEQAVAFGFKPGGNMNAMLGALDKDLGNIKVSIDEKNSWNCDCNCIKALIAVRNRQKNI